MPILMRGLAPLTIGLSPNFIAGEAVDLAIETKWGERLGEIVEAGATLPLAGEPRPIGGVGRARFIYAPQAGRFKTAARIGDRVTEGEPVASIYALALREPIGGVLRDLTRSGVSSEYWMAISTSMRSRPILIFCKTSLTSGSALIF